MSEKKIKRHIEHIIWEDHSGGTMSWEDLDEVAKRNEGQYYIHTVGVVIAENKNAVTMVQSLACNGMAGHHMTILKRCILKRKKLDYITEKVS